MSAYTWDSGPPLPRLWNAWGWRLMVAQWLLLLGILTGFRVAFFGLYREHFSDAALWDILLGFLGGVRFDLSVIFAFTGLPALVFLLLSPLPIRRWVFWLNFVYVALFTSGMATLGGLDLFYYETVSRRLSFEVFALVADWRPILGMVTGGFALQAGTVALLLVVALVVAVLRFRRKVNQPWQPVFWWSQMMQLAVFFLLMAVVVRGGLQTKPLSVGMAFRSTHMASGHLALNPVFTTTSAWWRKDLRLLGYYSEEAALDTTRTLLGAAEPPEDDRYPLLRKQEALAPPRPKNLVIIVLESFSPQFTGVMGQGLLENGRDVTPFFDRLTREGRLFTNFYSSGTRSLEGIASVLTGFPAMPNGTLIGTTLAQSRLRSLPLILSSQGYHSFFLHGAFRGSMWFDDFAARHGFQRYIAKEDFPNAQAISDSTWGVFDHYSLERLHEELEASGKPVLAFYFSLSSHTPFELPGKRFRKFGPDVPNTKLLNSIAYTDYALGRFFDLARQSGYWADTVFMVTADHNMGSSKYNHRQRMWIPLLILDPGNPRFLRGTVDPTLGSQTDIAATALDLLGISAGHAFAGNSLLRPELPRFAMLGWGNQAGWLRPGSLLIHDTERPLALYRFPVGVGSKVRMELPPPTRPAPDDPMVVELQGYLQTLNNLLINNRLAP